MASGDMGTCSAEEKGGRVCFGHVMSSLSGDRTLNN
jgi:hypothetical protein